MDFSELVRELLAERTQASVAAEVGVTRQAVSQWCRGVDLPTPTNLDRLMEACRANRTTRRRMREALYDAHIERLAR